MGEGGQVLIRVCESVSFCQVHHCVSRINEKWTRQDERHCSRVADFGVPQRKVGKRDGIPVTGYVCDSQLEIRRVVCA